MARIELQKEVARNVLGQPLQLCGNEPMTGFYRDGCCNTGPDDRGVHTVCAIVTEKFLAVSKQLGNDLSTPAKHFGFPGLKAGDCWCVCAARWLEVYEAGAACPVKLESTHENTLRVVPFEILLQHAVIPDKLV